MTYYDSKLMSRWLLIHQLILDVFFLREFCVTPSCGHDVQPFHSQPIQPGWQVKEVMADQNAGLTQ